MQYELEEIDEESVPWLWLLVLAVIVWSGAWWFAEKDTVWPQGETITSLPLLNN